MERLLRVLFVAFLLGGLTPISSIEVKAQTVEYEPIDAYVFRGNHMSGGLDELLAADSNYFTMNIGLGGTSYCDPTWSVVATTVLDTDSPTTLRYSVLAQANSPGVGMGTAVWNWTESRWIRFDTTQNCFHGRSPISFGVDDIYTVDLTKYINDVIEPGTGQVRLQTLCDKAGFTILDALSLEISVDRIWWETTEGNTTDFAPTSFSVFRGLIEGGLSEITTSDDIYVTGTPGFNLGVCGDDPLMFVVEGTLADDSPDDLLLTIESRANTPGISMNLQVFNWLTGQYETCSLEFDTPSQVVTDTNTVFDLNHRVSDVVEPGTSNVRMRFAWRKTGFTSIAPWQISIDDVFWSTTSK